MHCLKGATNASIPQLLHKQCDDITTKARFILLGIHRHQFLIGRDQKAQSKNTHLRNFASFLTRQKRPGNNQHVSFESFRPWWIQLNLFRWNYLLASASSHFWALFSFRPGKMMIRMITIFFSWSTHKAYHSPQLNPTQALTYSLEEIHCCQLEG